MNYRSFFSGLILAAFAIFIFHFSLQDAPTSNALSTQVTETMYEIIAPIIEDTTYSISTLNNIIRDLAHFSLFLFLGLISMCAFLYQHFTILKSACITLLLGSLVAIMDECVQLNSNGRAFELIDLGKDVLGITVSIILVWCFISIISLFKRR